MKQIFKLGILFLAGFFAFSSSCTKDVFTEEDAFANQEDLELLKDSLATAQAQMNNDFAREMELLRDSLKRAGGIIDYSVAAVLASDAAWLSLSGDKVEGDSKGGQGMDGVTVTVSQYGQILTSTTNISGIAAFSDLRIGSVTVNVSKTGYCEVDFIAVLPALPDSVYVDAYSLVRQAGTMVPMFSLTDDLSTISGIATVETNLTNDAQEAAANVKIVASIDVECPTFYSRYIQMPSYDVYGCEDCGYWSFDYYAIIRQIAFHSAVFEATTAADGSFSLSVPSTPDGLPYFLSASEFATNQTLLQATLNNVPVWGVQTVRTFFGPPTMFSYSSIPTNGTGLYNVQSAYVTFSAPTGTPDAQPTEVAEATAVLTSSGIISINMINQGEGYTQAPRVRIEPGSGYNSVMAEGTAVVSGGKVTDVTITSEGSGYAPDDEPAIIFEESVQTVATAYAEFSWSVVDIEMTDNGSGYTSTAPDVTIVGSGTGAAAHAIMSSGVTDINVTDQGSGYTSIPLVTVSDNFSSWTDATAVMTENNPLHSITYQETNDFLWESTPSATIYGDGTGATADVTISNQGEVVRAIMNNAGSGYDEAPEVTFSGGGSGFGADAYAVLGLGADTVWYIVITDGGQGYTTNPTITFTGGGGSGASATAVRGYPVTDIALVAAGVGYSDVTNIVLDDGTYFEDYVDDCDVKFNMKVRDVDMDWNGYFFQSVPTVAFTPTDGNVTTAAEATAVLTWIIKDIEVDNPGSGYLVDDANDVTVLIDPPAGAGTQAEAGPTLGNGVLSGAELFEHGQGYTAAPHVIVAIDYDEEEDPVPPVQQAQMTASVSNGQLTGITITDPGAGYDFDTYNNGLYYIDITTFNSEPSADAQANPESGQIDYIAITNPGAGYVVAPKIEIIAADTAAANGFGSGAVATATIVDGRVAEITVTNAGSGYYVAPAVNMTVPFSSMTAVGRCNVTSDGRITGVDFSGGYPFTQGYGYTSPPTVTFTPSIGGKGTGAAGVAVVSNGRVTSMVMTNQGSGYIGKNNPNSAQSYSIFPVSYPVVMATAGKSYVRDINFGTGKRTIEQ
ncbi:MAG: hypothetical protein V1903_10600 [Bacteroidota bacterium]